MTTRYDRVRRWDARTYMMSREEHQALLRERRAQIADDAQAGRLDGWTANFLTRRVAEVPPVALAREVVGWAPAEEVARPAVAAAAQPEDVPTRARRLWQRGGRAAYGTYETAQAAAAALARDEAHRAGHAAGRDNDWLGRDAPPTAVGLEERAGATAARERYVEDVALARAESLHAFDHSPEAEQAREVAESIREHRAGAAGVGASSEMPGGVSERVDARAERLYRIGEYPDAAAAREAAVGQVTAEVREQVESGLVRGAARIEPGDESTGSEWLRQSASAIGLERAAGAIGDDEPAQERRFDLLGDANEARRAAEALAETLAEERAEEGAPEPGGAGAGGEVDPGVGDGAPAGAGTPGAAELGGTRVGEGAVAPAVDVVGGPAAATGPAELGVADGEQGGAAEAGSAGPDAQYDEAYGAALELTGAGGDRAPERSRGASQWRTMGVGADDAAAWTAAGFTPGEAEGWIGQGVSSDRATEARQWANEFYRPDEARAHMEAGRTVEDARRAEDEGSGGSGDGQGEGGSGPAGSPERMTEDELRDAVEKVVAAREYVAAGENGALPEALAELDEDERQRLIDGARDVQAREAQGLARDARDVAAAQGVIDAIDELLDRHGGLYVTSDMDQMSDEEFAQACREQREAWTGAGFTPADARQWIAAGVPNWNAGAARGWADAGYPPSVAAEHLQEAWTAPALPYRESDEPVDQYPEEAVEQYLDSRGAGRHETYADARRADYEEMADGLLIGERGDGAVDGDGLDEAAEVDQQAQEDVGPAGDTVAQVRDVQARIEAHLRTEPDWTAMAQEAGLAQNEPWESMTDNHPWTLELEALSDEQRELCDRAEAEAEAAALQDGGEPTEDAAVELDGEARPFGGDQAGVSPEVATGSAAAGVEAGVEVAGGSAAAGVDAGVEVAAGSAAAGVAAEAHSGSQQLGEAAGAAVADLRSQIDARAAAAAAPPPPTIDVSSYGTSAAPTSEMGASDVL